MSKSGTTPDVKPRDDHPAGAEPATSVSRTIRIAAEPDDVWHALTRPEELTNWFPVDAEVEPGEGGRVRQAWDDTTWFEERIEIWKPAEHLRTVGVDGGWAGIATDYRIESDHGETILRVVSSGFGPDDDWQDLLDAFGGGWDFELRGLRHYLEKHPGETRRIVRATGTHDGDMARVWSILTDWFGASRPDSVPAPFSTTTSTDDHFTGSILDWKTPGQIVASLNEYNESLLRVQALPESIGSGATLWLSVFGVDEDRLRDLESRWQAWLDEHVLASDH